MLLLMSLLPGNRPLFAELNQVPDRVELRETLRTLLGELGHC